MPIQNRKGSPLIVLTVCLIIILDQLSKFVIRQILPIGGTLPIIKNALHLTYVQNLGAAFGIFKRGAVFFIFVSGLAIIFILLIFLCEILRSSFGRPQDELSGKIPRHFNLRLRLALAMILAGAVGNFIDRARFGYVIDFIDIRVWPVFNIADTAITIGSFLLGWELILHRPQ